MIWYVARDGGGDIVYASPTHQPGYNDEALDDASNAEIQAYRAAVTTVTHPPMTVPAANRYTYTVASGFSQQLADNANQVNFLAATALLGSGTIIMPQNPMDGQFVSIRSAPAVSSLTMTPGSGTTIANPLTSFPAGGGGQWTYRAAASNWDRTG